MKDILIIFSDIHLSYSPTTLNIYDSLIQQFNVTILTVKPDEVYSNHKIIDRNIEYLNYENWTPEKAVPLRKRLYYEIAKSFSKSTPDDDVLLNKKAEAIIDRILKFNGIIIVIDFFALWCVQKAGKVAHFVSLEIIEDDPYRKSCNLDAIQSVFIQSEIRYEYLFGNRKIKTFIIQNAPKYIEQVIDYKLRKSNNLIFCGSAMTAFGIFSCLEYLLDYPDYILTVKGAIPKLVRKRIEERFGNLLSQNRLILDEKYLDPVDLNKYLEQYYVGFVFYDDYRFDHLNTFNYQTAPSGKMFQYFNAGIPIIASNLRGLTPIIDFGAGVLIDTLNSKCIKNAFDQIESNYEVYCKASKMASLNFDFSKSVGPYISFLQEF